MDWDDATIIVANFNNRALNALFCGVTNEEFKRISSTDVAKEAWTILETTYEGTNAVKTVKLQRLTSSFEEGWRSMRPLMSSMPNLRIL